jgi:hypothetical protein
VKVSSPPPILMDHVSTKDFDITWQRWIDGIGEYNEDYFDKQEGELWSRESSCDEIEEDDFDMEDYANVKEGILRNCRAL